MVRTKPAVKDDIPLSDTQIVVACMNMLDFLAEQRLVQGEQMKRDSLLELYYNLIGTTKWLIACKLPDRPKQVTVTDTTIPVTMAPIGLAHVFGEQE